MRDRSNGVQGPANAHTSTVLHAQASCVLMPCTVNIMKNPDQRGGKRTWTIQVSVDPQRHVPHASPLPSHAIASTATSLPYSPFLPIRSPPQAFVVLTPTVSSPKPLPGICACIGGEALSRPAAPASGSEMLIARDAIGDENGIPNSRGRCSGVIRRKDNTPPDTSNTSTLEIVLSIG